MLERVKIQLEDAFSTFKFDKLRRMKCSREKCNKLIKLFIYVML